MGNAEKEKVLISDHKRLVHSWLHFDHKVQLKMHKMASIGPQPVLLMLLLAILHTRTRDLCLQQGINGLLPRGSELLRLLIAVR